MRYDSPIKVKAAILIPARYASSRFPGKPLAKLLDKPMVLWVAEHMQETKLDVYVVTDDDQIEALLRSKNQNVLRVDDDVPCGTDRIYLAYKRFLKEKNYDLILNVQGDEPLLPASQVFELAQFHASEEGKKFSICTLVLEKDCKKDFLNPSCVKTIYSKDTKECHYFSRAPIPCDRDGEFPLKWYHHVGVYSYRPEALEDFVKRPSSDLEKREKLEQLRGLELGFRFGALITKEQLAGVDTPEDLERVEKILRERI